MAEIGLTVSNSKIISLCRSKKRAKATMEREVNEGKRRQLGEGERRAFWHFCVYASYGAIARCVKSGLPCTIDAHYLDKLFVDQGWRCAVSYVPFTVPQTKRNPFGPSVDRIVPSLGYVPGNVRLVCMMVNFAMNHWGEEPLRKLMSAWRDANSLRPE